MWTDDYLFYKLFIEADYLEAILLGDLIAIGSRDLSSMTGGKSESAVVVTDFS